MPLTIGVDVGGTKIAAGVVSKSGEILERQRQMTPARDARATSEAIVAMVRDLRTRHDV